MYELDLYYEQNAKNPNTKEYKLRNKKLTNMFIGKTIKRVLKPTKEYELHHGFVIEFTDGSTLEIGYESSHGFTLADGKPVKV